MRRSCSIGRAGPWLLSTLVIRPTSQPHCPFCHGWEVRGQRIAVLAPAAAEPYVDLFRLRSDDVTHVVLPDTGVGSVSVEDAGSDLVITSEAGRARVDVIFSHPMLTAVDDLPEQLGLQRQATPYLPTPVLVATNGSGGFTSVPGVFVAGDLVDFPPSVPVAFASGTRAAGQA